MTDQEEYEQLKEDSKKNIEKIRESDSSNEIAELCSELNAISKRKVKIRDRS